jgi:hypothetical protein
VCYLGGRQFFHDPRVGDFSITFTGKDTEGEGLTRPVLQLADVGNWAEIPVSTLASEHLDLGICKKHAGVGCDKGPYICTYGDTGNGWPWDGRTRKWFCGIPKRGKGFEGGGTELDSNVPTPKGYAPGQCGIHVTQYQKPDPSKDPYSYDAKIFDANQNEIGNTGGKQPGPILVVNSKLPMGLTITARAVDTDALHFGYDGVMWDGVAPSCSVGKFDNGKRVMDCGFNCN